MGPVSYWKKLRLAMNFIHMATASGYKSNKQLGGLISRIMVFEQENEENQILWKQAKISELQSQINPHFLYNTLESIRGQALEDHNQKIADMTEALAKYFRYSINKENDIVELSKEMENINNYIHIQQYRFEDRFQFLTKIDNDVDLSVKLPKMTLQPIVENALFHGIETRVSDGKILLKVTSNQKDVFIVVQDNGKGMDEETLRSIQVRFRTNDGILENRELKKHMGIALINVNHRLKLLFGEEYGLQVNSAFGIGTEVILTVPREGKI